MNINYNKIITRMCENVFRIEIEHLILEYWTMNENRAGPSLTKIQIL